MSSKLNHFDHDGRARFVTFCTRDRLPLLTNNDFRQRLVNVIESEHRIGRFELLGWIFMPDHVHLVLVPALNERLGLLIGDIKRISARSIHEELVRKHSPLPERLSVVKETSVQFAFWQKRCYARTCRTDGEIRKTIEYCHYNPVAKGLVKHPEDWLWSSYCDYYGTEKGKLTIDHIELIGD